MPRCFKLTEPGAPRRLVHRGRVLAAFPAHRSEQAVQDAIDAHPADNRQTWRRSMAFLLSDCTSTGGRHETGAYGRVCVRQV